MGARGASQPIVAATIEVFRTVSDALLPTPAKSHYTFNLRDLSKVTTTGRALSLVAARHVHSRADLAVCLCSLQVIQGVLGVAPDLVESQDKMIQLWIHEEQRVFKDRLIDDKDRSYFDNLLSDMTRSAEQQRWWYYVRNLQHG